MPVIKILNQVPENSGGITTIWDVLLQSTDNQEILSKLHIMIKKMASSEKSFLLSCRALRAIRKMLMSDDQRLNLVVLEMIYLIIRKDNNHVQLLFRTFQDENQSVDAALAALGSRTLRRIKRRSAVSREILDSLLKILLFITQCHQHRYEIVVLLYKSPLLNMVLDWVKIDTMQPRLCQLFHMDQLTAAMELTNNKLLTLELYDMTAAELEQTYNCLLGKKKFGDHRLMDVIALSHKGYLANMYDISEPGREVCIAAALVQKGVAFPKKENAVRQGGRLFVEPVHWVDPIHCWGLIAPIPNPGDYYANSLEGLLVKDNVVPLGEEIQEGLICVIKINYQYFRCQVCRFDGRLAQVFLLDAGYMLESPPEHLYKPSKTLEKTFDISTTLRLLRLKDVSLKVGYPELILKSFKFLRKITSSRSMVCLQRDSLLACKTSHFFGKLFDCLLTWLSSPESALVNQAAYLLCQIAYYDFVYTLLEDGSRVTLLLHEYDRLSTVLADGGDHSLYEACVFIAVFFTQCLQKSNELHKVLKECKGVELFVQRLVSADPVTRRAIKPLLHAYAGYNKIDAAVNSRNPQNRSRKSIDTSGSIENLHGKFPISRRSKSLPRRTPWNRTLDLEGEEGTVRATADQMNVVDNLRSCLGMGKPINKNLALSFLEKQLPKNRITEGTFIDYQETDVVLPIKNEGIKAYYEKEFAKPLVNILNSEKGCGCLRFGYILLPSKSKSLLQVIGLKIISEYKDLLRQGIDGACRKIEPSVKSDSISIQMLPVFQRNDVPCHNLFVVDVTVRTIRGVMSNITYKYENEQVFSVPFGVKKYGEETCPERPPTAAKEFQNSLSSTLSDCKRADRVMKLADLVEDLHLTAFPDVRKQVVVEAEKCILFENLKNWWKEEFPASCGTR